MTYYIGIMTGNSMDAIDVVYASVSSHTIHPIHTLSVPFTADMQQQTGLLRQVAAQCNTRQELEALPLFQSVHQKYITQTAQAVAQLIQENQIDLTTLSAICSHGKTLDHCPPSSGASFPYTLQIGSGKLLADEINRILSLQNIPHPPIRVIYDFRSDDMMNGGDGAPLIPPLNELIAQQDNQPNRLDINAGNTSNLCLIRNGKAVAGWDIGPCNEYMDYLVRTHTNLPFDKDGHLAQSGHLDTKLLEKLFEINADFYHLPPPKSSDPRYYHTNEITAFQEKEKLADNLFTAAYFSAYLTVFTLQFIPDFIPGDFSLFGGGWKHPVLKNTLESLLNGEGFILPKHQACFQKIRQRLTAPTRIHIHPYGQWMESLLWARMGYCYDHQIPWTTPTLTGCKTSTVCGIETVSDCARQHYDDSICRAYKGWQKIG